MAESLSDNDSHRDGEEEDDVSDNDLEIMGEQSGTPDSTRLVVMSGLTSV